MRMNSKFVVAALTLLILTAGCVSEPDPAEKIPDNALHVKNERVDTDGGQVDTEITWYVMCERGKAYRKEYKIFTGESQTTVVNNSMVEEYC